MKYLSFFILAFISILPHVSALQIEYQQAPKNTMNILPWQETLFPKQHIHVDFWTGLTAEKTHHFIEIFPQNSEKYIPTFMPTYTPEWEYIKNLVSPEIWSRIWDSYVTMEKSQKIHLFTMVIKWSIEDDEIQLPQKTNSQNTLYYTVESPEDSVQTIRIFPVKTTWYWFLGWNGLERFSFKGILDDIENNSDIPMPPLVMLGSDLDMYDIFVETDEDNFSQVFTPKSRKLFLTHFTPDYQLAYYGEIQQNLFSLLPYYEMDIPLKKWTNTVRITYKSFIHTPDEFNEYLKIEK